MSKVYSDLHINGKLIYNNNPTNGYVLTTDDYGLVSWTSSTNTIATASETTPGHIRVGSGLTMSSLGILSVSGGGGGGSEYFPGVGLTLSGPTFSLSYKKYKTIYVSATGSNSNDGYANITPVLDLYVARDLAVSGDTIVVMPGSYIFDNRNSAGCPYNGLVESKVNLWKDGVTYHFLPGAKIYSYGSTSVSYSPYSDNMIFFQPNSLTYSVCSVVGDLEFYATSEGNDNSGGNSQLFEGLETNGSSTYPGYTFNLSAKIIDSITGCTLLSANRTSADISPAYINMDIDTIRYRYTTGQSYAGCFSTWRGGDNTEMYVNIRVNQIISDGGSSWKPVFQIRPTSTTGINKLRVSIDVNFASMLGYAYMLIYQTDSTSNLISSGQINFNCNSCVFSASLFMIHQTYKNFYISITGNYYCSGSFTGKYSSVPSTYPFLSLWDQTNDVVGANDFSIVDFKGNYYTNNSTRTIAHLGYSGTTTTPVYGYTNEICNFTGDIYFVGTASNYTGTLFYVDMGKMRFSGRIHGTKNYSGYGFAGVVMQFGGSSDGFLTSAHIHSDSNSSLVSYGSPVNGQSTLTISNSFIDMTGTSSVIGDMRDLNTYVQNSTIRNKGTNDMFYNSLSTGTLQITNSTLINLSTTASTINYPLGTVTSAGVYSNKDIIVATLNGTVSVVSSLI